jgi:uncharacterized membrane protein YgdD (TMEM256/DUF423 family)
VERTFLILGALFGLTGVALGAFGTHALRAKLPPERLATFETGVRYHLIHALALFAVVLTGRLRYSTVVGGELSGQTLYFGSIGGWAIAAGWLFVAGIVLFSGSLYLLARTGEKRWGAVTPFGGFCWLAAWALLAGAAWTGNSGDGRGSRPRATSSAPLPSPSAPRR